VRRRTMNEAIVAKEPSALGTIAITPEQVDLVKTTVFQGATDDELKLYFFECRRRGVHPLDRLIHPVVRQDKNGTRRISFQTSIDLFRSEAENTGEYRGQDDVEYGELITWEKIDKKVPEYAKATIKRFDEHTGEIIKISATAYWEEYYPGEQLGFQWRKMPRLMLGKCAEALALRKAFPRKLAGLYTFEEMQLTDLINQGKALKEPQRKQKPEEQKQDKEMKEPGRQSESNGQPEIKDPDAPATEPQKKAIHTMLGKIGVKENDKKHDFCSKLFPVPTPIKSLNDITKGQASYIIDKLNSYKPETGDQLV